MCKIRIIATILLVVFASSAAASAADTEQDIINRYLKKTQKKHVRKLGWISASFDMNRINKDNDYNKFASSQTEYLDNGTILWLNKAKSVSMEFGMFLGDRFAWSMNGEYWLKLGQNNTGTFTYSPPGGSPSVITNLQSEIKVVGFITGMDYYISNRPSKDHYLESMALRISGSVGYYIASWDLWNSFQNLNLSTSTPAPTNTTFKGTAPGLSLGMGADYPLNFQNFSLGVDFSYLYLNFKNIAWYNSIDQEVVPTWNNDADSRVDLGLSGFRGKVELKRFFTW